MTNRTAIHPRLHALIGDIATDVPEDLAREIECALKEQQIPPSQPMFFTFLDAIRKGDGEDGQPCTTQALNAQTLASLGRSLSALNAVLDLLRRADRRLPSKRSAAGRAPDRACRADGSGRCDHSGGKQARVNRRQQKSPHRWRLFSFCNMVGGTGIEPVTLAV